MGWSEKSTSRALQRSCFFKVSGLEPSFLSQALRRGRRPCRFSALSGTFVIMVCAVPGTAVAQKPSVFVEWS